MTGYAISLVTEIRICHKSFPDNEVVLQLWSNGSVTWKSPEGDN